MGVADDFKQVIAVFTYLFALVLFGPLCLCSLLYMLFFTEYYWISLLYGVWWLYDLSTCNTGGRRTHLVQWVRRWSLWRHLRDYFPIKMIKTAELDPRRNYIFSCHPHGVICFGSVTVFASEADDFSVKYPGINAHVNTVEGNLWMPGFREFFLMFGAVASSKESLSFLLSNPDGGEAAVLMVGGIPEMDNFHDKQINLVLNKRKGFIKLALRNGTSLVPTFVFGETHLYKQSGLVSRLQEKIRDLIGIAPVIFYGRGFLQNSFGFLPHRTPMTVVVGEPIIVQKVSEPSIDEIDKLHALYVKKVKKLYSKYNPIYGSMKTKLVIE